jgi:hypothetical protein
MALLDHFRPPLFPMRNWEAILASWAASITASLNGALLPKVYYAEASVHVGSRVEVDVGAFEDSTEVADKEAPHDVGGGTALAVERATWVIPNPKGTLNAIYPDSVEVLIYADEGGAILAAAIELVSPGNKDREDTRKAFVAKCSSYLQQGVGLVIVDIVTSRRANLHKELAEFLGGDAGSQAEVGLYASAYRPVRRKDSEHHDVWVSELSLGSQLPTMPLALRRGPTLPLDLDAPYREACSRARID